MEGVETETDYEFTDMEYSETNFNIYGDSENEESFVKNKNPNGFGFTEDD